MELQQCEVTAHSSFDLPIPLEWSSSKKSQTKKAGEIVERRQPSYTIGENLSGEATTEDSTEIPYETKNRVTISSVQFSSVTQSCPTLCNPMNRSMPGLPVHHQLPESTQTHVHRVSDAIQPSHPLSSPFPPAPSPSQHQSLFQ